MEQPVSNGWKPFSVEYGFKGQRVKEEAYLTVTLGTPKQKSRQIVILPTCGVLLASWESDEPADLVKLRKTAIENVSKLGNAEESAPLETSCC